MDTSSPVPRSDSFTFLRLVLALLVVFGHCFPLGGFTNEPLGIWSGGQLCPDSLGVKGFFILSGYLLMHALTHRPSLPRFAMRRFFRIMPAFWVCLLVSAFVVAPAIISLMLPSPISYWESITLGKDNAVSYVTSNALLHIRQREILPVFFFNHSPRATNGSLWTLSYEALCYAGLALAAALGLTRRKFLMLAGFAALYLTCVIFAFWPFAKFSIRGAWGLILNDGIHPGGHNLALAFMAGVAAHVLTGGKPFWNRNHFLVASIVLVSALRFGGFALIWPLLLPYVLLSLAYKLPFQSFERLGDFSYGTYLYAFLMQQCLYAFGVHHAGLAVYFGLSVILSVACGALSWMLVEKPAIHLGIRLCTSGGDYFKALRTSGALPAPIKPVLS